MPRAGLSRGRAAASAATAAASPVARKARVGGDGGGGQPRPPRAPAKGGVGAAGKGNGKASSVGKAAATGASRAAAAAAVSGGSRARRRGPRDTDAGTDSGAGSAVRRPALSFQRGAEGDDEARATDDDDGDGDDGASAAEAASPGEHIGEIPLGGRFSLSQSICSYGYFGLAPNRWTPAPDHVEDDDEGVFERPLVFGTPHHEETDSGATVDWIGGDRPATEGDVEQVLAQARRILRAGWSPDGFWALHPEARERGFGRTFRSPTLWEDMVKTLTNCNMTWKGTCRMNELLCRELGHHGVGFPTPAQVAAAADAGGLQERCKLGYRTAWIADLARKFCTAEVDPAWFERPDARPDDIRAAVTAHKGFGRFAAHNVLQLLGHHDACPFDTETVRLFREEKGVAKSVPSAKVHAMAEAHYSHAAPYRFLGYWFDLWQNYERRAGRPSPRWRSDTCETVG